MGKKLFDREQRAAIGRSDRFPCAGKALSQWKWSMVRITVGHKLVRASLFHAHVYFCASRSEVNCVESNQCASVRDTVFWPSKRKWAIQLKAACIFALSRDKDLNSRVGRDWSSEADIRPLKLLEFYSRQFALTFWQDNITFRSYMLIRKARAQTRYS